MPETFKRLQDAFGWTDLPRPLFYNSRFALRFQLGGAERMGPVRFLRAMDRARAVATVAFAGADRLHVAISYFAGKRRSSGPSRDIAALAEMGFTGVFGPALRRPPRSADEAELEAESVFRYIHFAEFPNDPGQIALLLWASLSAEMPIAPCLSWLSANYILDLRRGIALLAYDDRGMDLAARQAEALAPCYRRFNDWLLDHDRPAMDAIFAAGA